jgi:putative oxidoreductase
MGKFKTGLRYLLGAIYFVFGLNFFLHFIPMPPPPPEMMGFFEGIMKMGYLLPFVKCTEIACGALLILNLFVPLALVVLAPISLNILLVHTLIDPSGLPMAGAIVVVHVLLGIAYLSNYKPMLKMKA